MKDKQIKKTLWTQAYTVALDNSLRGFQMDLAGDNPEKAHAALREVQRQASCFAFAAVQAYEQRFEKNKD